MQDQEQAAATIPPRPLRARRGWFALRGLALVVLAPLVFVAACAVMIVDRDITAPSWVTQMVQDRAAGLLGGGSLRFGSISMRIATDLRPSIRLIDTSVIDRDGGLITRIPLVEADLSPRGLILRRNLLVQQVRVTGAQVNLRRASDGRLSLAFGSGIPPGARSLTELLDQIDGYFETPALEALRLVTATGLVVNYDDARAGRSFIVDGGAVTLDLRGGRTSLDAELALLTGRDVVSTAVLAYRSPRDSRASSLALVISDVQASDIAGQSPALQWLSDINAPVSAVLRTSLDDTGALGPLQGTLEIGAGVLQPNPAAEPVSFSAAEATLRYDPVLDLIQFSDVAVESDWGSLRARGDAYLRDFVAGLPRAMLAQFTLQNVVLNPPGLFDAPPLIDRASVDLRLRLDPFMVDIGQVVVQDGPSRLIVTGEIDATDAGWQVALDSQIDEIAPDRLLALWPNGFRPGTRNWVAGNVAAGQLSDLHFGLRIVPGRPLNLAGHFSFDDTAVTVLPDLPPLTDGQGIASLSDDRFVVALDAGRMTPPDGGAVAMDGSTFAIEDLRQRPSPATLALRSQSSVPSLLAIINQPPFRFMDRANLPVTIADGVAQAQGVVTLPLSLRPPRDQIRFGFDVGLRDVRSDVLIAGRTLTASDLQLRVDDAGISIAGPVQLDGVAADAVWRQSFDPDLPPGSALQAEIDLSPDGLAAFGIALPAGMVTGQGRGQLQVTLPRGSPPQFVLTSDLQGLRIAIPAVGWAKAAGTTGALRVAGTLGPVPVITGFTISGGGLQAAGRIDLAAGGGLDRAVFSQLRIGDWLDAPITLRGRGAGQPFGVEIGGGTLDLRRAQFGSGGGGGNGGGPVQIVLDRLVVTEGISLTDFRGGFTTLAGFTGQFSGLVNGAAAVTGTVAPRDGRSAVRLRSDDAGAVLQAAGLFGTAFGGALDLTLLPAGGEGTFDGTLSVRSLRVRDAPSIAALLDAISVVGLIQQLDGQGLSFDTVDAQFRLTPAQVIVTQASAVGPGLGISVDGLYTLASKQFDLQGVVSPFYLINSIGSFLTRRGEGLVGINFTIAGTSDAPRVGVNPLSILTPGMFRDIFRRPPPELTQ